MDDEWLTDLGLEWYLEVSQTTLYPISRSPGNRQVAPNGESRISFVSGYSHSMEMSVSTDVMDFFRDLIICQWHKYHLVNLIKGAQGSLETFSI